MIKTSKSFKEKMAGMADKANTCCRGILDLVRGILQNAKAARVSEAAAGLAYYAFFSLFPFLLILALVGSFFLQRDEVYQNIISAISQAIPVSTDYIEQVVNSALNMRGSIGVVGALTALWSASSAFTLLATNINRAWHTAETRSFARKRLVALAMIGVLGALLLLSLFSSAVFALLPQFNFPENRESFNLIRRIILTVVKYGVPFLITWFMFMTLYRWVPDTHVKWKAAFWGSLVTSVVWEVVKQLFTWYLRSDLARYEIVYGSLGTLVALLFWIYLSANIILYGAHLSAYLDE